MAHRRWIRLIVSKYCNIKRCQIGKKINSKGKLTPDQTQEANLPHTIKQTWHIAWPNNKRETRKISPQEEINDKANCIQVIEKANWSRPKID